MLIPKATCELPDHAADGVRDAVKESNDVWNQLALHVPTKAVPQPTLLTGGRLHDHQLQVPPEAQAGSNLLKESAGL